MTTYNSTSIMQLPTYPAELHESSVTWPEFDEHVAKYPTAVKIDDDIDPETFSTSYYTEEDGYRLHVATVQTILYGGNLFFTYSK